MFGTPTSFIKAADQVLKYGLDYNFDIGVPLIKGKIILRNDIFQIRFYLAEKSYAESFLSKPELGELKRTVYNFFSEEPRGLLSPQGV